MAKRRPSRHHDAYFRGAFSLQSVVLIYLKKFLPLELAGQLDLGSLQKSPDSFVDRRLKSTMSDVV